MESVSLDVTAGASLAFEKGEVFAGLGANVSVAGTFVLLASAALSASHAAFGFAKTENSVLNAELDASALLPHSAVADLVSARSVHPQLRPNMYALDVTGTSAYGPPFIFSFLFEREGSGLE